jgi:DNA-directed RNA polymerase subunit M/transcription elongation factor TFIIS
VDCPKCHSNLLGKVEEYDNMFTKIKMLYCMICGYEKYISHETTPALQHYFQEIFNHGGVKVKRAYGKKMGKVSR